MSVPSTHDMISYVTPEQKANVATRLQEALPKAIRDALPHVDAEGITVTAQHNINREVEDIRFTFPTKELAQAFAKTVRSQLCQAKGQACGLESACAALGATPEEVTKSRTQHTSLNPKAMVRFARGDSTTVIVPDINLLARLTTALEGGNESLRAAFTDGVRAAYDNPAKGMGGPGA